MPELAVKTLITIALLVGLVGLFILSYLLNKRVPKPEGCDQEKNPGCAQCPISSCSLHHINDEEKKD